MSSDPISRISPTLAETPDANFLLWLQSVKHNARAILADKYTYGLLHLPFALLHSQEISTPTMWPFLHQLQPGPRL